MLSPLSWLRHSAPSWDNRRSGPRLGMQLPLQLDSKPAELANLSESGLRLKSAWPLERGQSVVVSPTPHLNPVGRRRARCRVIWCRRRHGIYQVGLGWKDVESWIQFLWQRVRPDWQVRRHLRIRCQFPIEVHLGDGRNLPGARCLDISLGGCLLRLQRWLAPGTAITLTLGADTSLWICGEVLATHKGLVHVRFRGPEQARLRGFLSNLKDLSGQCPADPLVEVPPLDSRTRTVAPFLAPMKDCGPVPQPRSPEQICGNKLGLPEVVAQLKLRQSVLRCPSVWSARHLPLLALT